LETDRFKQIRDGSATMYSLAQVRTGLIVMEIRRKAHQMCMGSRAQCVVRILFQWNPKPSSNPANAGTAAYETQHSVDDDGQPNVAL
jgi:hypothetical protein